LQFVNYTKPFWLSALTIKAGLIDRSGIWIGPETWYTGEHLGTIRNSYHKLRLHQTRFRLKIAQNNIIVNQSVH
jgi:hypothetical protein